MGKIPSRCILMDKFDPEEIKKMRRVMPSIIVGNDFVGLSPMKGPTMAIFDMRNVNQLLQLADELDAICMSADYDSKDFKNALDKFTNLYKKCNDNIQSEYHKRFAEKMKNG